MEATSCFKMSVDFLRTIRRYVPTLEAGARGSVVGWGTTLQAGRSRIRFPTRWLDFTIHFNPSSRTMVLNSTQPLTEISTRNLLGGKGRPTRKADLTAICEPTVLKIWQPWRLTTLWASTTCYSDRCTFFCLLWRILVKIKAKTYSRLSIVWISLQQ
jgi:hypothetical protein